MLPERLKPGVRRAAKEGYCFCPVNTGCTCDEKLNRRGAGLQDKPGVYEISAGCPVHDNEKFYERLLAHYLQEQVELAKRKLVFLEAGIACCKKLKEKKGKKSE